MHRVAPGGERAPSGGAEHLVLRVGDLAPPDPEAFNGHLMDGLFVGEHGAAHHEATGGHPDQRLPVGAGSLIARIATTGNRPVVQTHRAAEQQDGVGNADDAVTIRIGKRIVGIKADNDTQDADGVGDIRGAVPVEVAAETVLGRVYVLALSGKRRLRQVRPTALQPAVDAAWSKLLLAGACIASRTDGGGMHTTAGDEPECYPTILYAKRSTFSPAGGVRFAASCSSRASLPTGAG